MKKAKNKKRGAFLEDLVRIDDELQAIKKDIAVMKKELQEKVDLDRIETLEERVRKLELELARVRANK